MSSFTPGPWRISASCSRDECYVGISSNKHTDFADVVWRMSDEDRSPQCEANVHLITAAPDLYEACEAAVSMGDTRKVRAMLDAALKKARGEE